jgi:hypothetical protein
MDDADSPSAVELETGDGSALVIKLIGRSPHETTFQVTLRKPWLTARQEASTYVNGSPAGFFAEMARDWRGWVDEKQWEDLEGRVKLSASSDATGYSSLRVQMRGPNFEDRVEAMLTYEAGQLEHMSRAVDRLFKPD